MGAINKLTKAIDGIQTGLKDGFKSKQRNKSFTNQEIAAFVKKPVWKEWGYSIMGMRLSCSFLRPNPQKI